MMVDILRLAGNGHGANLRRVFYDTTEVTSYPEATAEIHRLIGAGIERIYNGTLSTVSVQNVRTGKGYAISLHGKPGAFQLFVSDHD